VEAALGARWTNLTLRLSCKLGKGLCVARETHLQICLPAGGVAGPLAGQPTGQLAGGCTARVVIWLVRSGQVVRFERNSKRLPSASPLTSITFKWMEQIQLSQSKERKKNKRGKNWLARNKLVCTPTDSTNPASQPVKLVSSIGLDFWFDGLVYIVAQIGTSSRLGWFARTCFPVQSEENLISC